MYTHRELGSYNSKIDTKYNIPQMLCGSSLLGLPSLELAIATIHTVAIIIIHYIRTHTMTVGHLL